MIILQKKIAQDSLRGIRDDVIFYYYCSLFLLCIILNYHKKISSDDDDDETSSIATPVSKSTLASQSNSVRRSTLASESTSVRRSTLASEEQPLALVGNNFKNFQVCLFCQYYKGSYYKGSSIITIGLKECNSS